MSLDHRARRFVQMMEASGGRGSRRSTPAERRAALVTMAEMADAADACRVTGEDSYVDGPAGALPLRIYRRLDDQRRLAPVTLFFHGGGWVAGGPETHDGLCRRLCQASGSRVVLVDYRLAPEHPFPAALDDCAAALDWTARHGPAAGLDPTRLAVAGDSVGAGLAAAVCAMARRTGGPDIRLQVLICPILDPGASETRLSARGGDGAFITRRMFQRDLVHYLGGSGATADDPRISPLRAPDFEGLPPALIETAEFDPFRVEGQAYANALAAAGTSARVRVHPGMIHYFYALARAIPYARQAAEAIGADIARHMGVTELAEDAA
jgi:acetyl esterase